MSDSEKQRDKQITREIHRLFWRSNLVKPWHLTLCVVTRFPAFMVYNVLIPVVVALALQAIILGNFD
jgi:hypothetical protein